jgi:hypothetical protein
VLCVQIDIAVGRRLEGFVDDGCGPIAYRVRADSKESGEKVLFSRSARRTVGRSTRLPSNAGNSPGR